MLIHDDVLATGGTVQAIGKLVEDLGGTPQQGSYTYGSEFEFGLELVLDGLERALARRG